MSAFIINGVQTQTLRNTSMGTELRQKQGRGDTEVFLSGQQPRKGPLYLWSRQCIGSGLPTVRKNDWGTGEGIL